MTASLSLSSCPYKTAGSVTRLKLSKSLSSEGLSQIDNLYSTPTARKAARNAAHQERPRGGKDKRRAEKARARRLVIASCSVAFKDFCVAVPSTYSPSFSASLQNTSQHSRHPPLHSELGASSSTMTGRGTLQPSSVYVRSSSLPSIFRQIESSTGRPVVNASSLKLWTVRAGFGENQALGYAEFLALCEDLVDLEDPMEEGGGREGGRRVEEEGGEGGGGEVEEVAQRAQLEQLAQQGRYNATKYCASYDLLKYEDMGKRARSGDAGSGSGKGKGNTGNTGNALLTAASTPDLLRSSSLARSSTADWTSTADRTVTANTANTVTATSLAAPSSRPPRPPPPPPPQQSPCRSPT